MEFFLLALRSLFHNRGQLGPKTPVRWLCLRTLDYLAVCQERALSGEHQDTVHRAIELGIFLNRYYDGKEAFDKSEYLRKRSLLPEQPTRDYILKIRVLERNRPQPGQWSEIAHYRRAVLRANLEFLFSLSELDPNWILLPLCELIQLTDDLLDIEIDRRLNLPTLVGQSSPSPIVHAKQLYRQILDYQEPQCAPIKTSAGMVYILTRLACLLSRFRRYEKVSD